MSAEQAQAILFGLALGDALGRPVEFYSLQKIKAEYGAAGIQEPPDPAYFTDDTQMTLALAEGLLDAGLEAAIDAQMDAVGRRFMEWADALDGDPVERAPGRTCLNGIQRFATGSPWRLSGIAESKGCGSAMRVAPIGYLYQHDERRLRDVAEASSLITHGHPTALAASIGAAYAVKLALDGASLSEYLPAITRAAGGLSDEFEDALRRVGHVAAWTDEETAIRHIGEGWVAEEAVALALYCVFRYPDDYAACVRRGANIDGDGDSVASIAGGIMGARLGLKAIPEAWIARCERREYLETLGTRLAEARAAVEKTA